MIRIAVDAMGGDIGPAVTIPASLAFLDGHPDAALIVVGQPLVLATHPQYAQLKAHARCHMVEIGRASCRERVYSSV